MSYEIEKDWQTKAGLRAICLVVVRNKRKKHRCGYVGIPKDHPLFRVEYGDNAPILRPLIEGATLGAKSPILAFTAGVNALPGDEIRCSPAVVFDVHGGITFSGGDKKYPVEGDLWWFGFDCAHVGDGEIEPDPRWGNHWDDEVRSREYVENECERLAEQIARIAPV